MKGTLNHFELPRRWHGAPSGNWWGQGNGIQTLATDRDDEHAYLHSNRRKM